ncbi:hypothetical protein A0257_04450 [Hymenobacter psoromatis]|nr:hypothetical protein A0257_04450 [Hymenobacter psoromatis]
MNATIPVFPLTALTEAEARPAVFFVGPDSPPTPQLPLDRPYRSDFYKIGLCRRGSARLQVNLETYALAPASLVVLSPHGIKQWGFRSADCASLSLFFTKAFVAAGGGLNPDDFAFFERDARPVLTLPPAAAASLAALLQTIGQKYAAPHVYREEILRSLLHVLLHETAPLYAAQHRAAPAGRTRGQLIAAGFKQLVHRHYATERSLAFYADQLCITPKHLAETVQAATGKSAGAWLTEAVLLEARVLLQNPALPIGQIAAALHFADSSTFGRFFRRHTGLTPARYRQQQ